MDNKIENSVEQYVNLKRQIEELEKQLEPVKKQLEEHAKVQPEKTFMAFGRKISLVDAVREHFELKKAKEVLAQEVLMPFIKDIHYTQLRVK
ncbi:hypothetical protein EBU95_03820 [bacterium]|nr:hypothetical protein [bacterium]